MKTSQKGFAPLVLMLIAAGVLVAGGAGYWWYQNQNSTPEQLIGGQKDAHGCLGPAGYSWCEAKQKCLRVWEEKCEATSTAQTSDSKTADWKTYSNSKYGFEINYPKKVSYDVVNSELINFYYDISDMEKILGIGLIKDNRILSISVMNNNDNLDIETWTRQTDTTGFPTKSIKQIKFNGLNAVEKISGEYNDNWISINIIGKNLKVYRLSYYKYGVQEMDLILNQILSTFKFNP